MTYHQKILSLANQIPMTLVDFDSERKRGRAPTQAFSEFLTNREQGDWAERLVLRAINETSKNYIAIQYGKSDNLVAGDEGFVEFYESYQDELDEIGKRPDILVFKKEFYKSEWGYDISQLPMEQLNKIVPNAIAGLEIRSSSFLIEKYAKVIKQRTFEAKRGALQIRDELLNDYQDVFSTGNRAKWLDVLNSLTEDNLSIISFKVPGWRSSIRLSEANSKLKQLKLFVNEIQKRDFLSITPKVEDIKVVYKWVETYNVPHYYFQVFFDKVYGMSYEKILKLICDSDREGSDYFIEGNDAKNQNKTTIKINSKLGKEVAYKVEMPEHKSEMRELGRGRLLFYVTFKGGRAYLNISNLLSLLDIREEEF